MNETMRPAMGLALLIGLGMPACADAAQETSDAPVEGLLPSGGRSQVIAEER